MNLKEVKQRIQSVKTTQKITSAMKLVSAAKLRRAQAAIEGIHTGIAHYVANDQNDHTASWVVIVYPTL